MAEEREPDPSPELSVVVALISGRRDDLERCLAALHAQVEPPATEIVVPYDDPEAAEYARRHLEQVREPIGDALAILRFHKEDVAAEAARLKRWIDAEVKRLTR